MLVSKLFVWFLILSLLEIKCLLLEAGNSTKSRTEVRKFRSELASYHVRATAIHVDKSEFPLSRLLFSLTLRLALDSASKKLEARRVKLSVNVRSANTCSRQFAGAIAAEEFHLRGARLFIVSGCDDAIRGVSKLASGWRVPVMTSAGFGADLNDKSVHKNLVRVAFSLKTAVEFLVKILKSFQWKRVNLIVDESDGNSLALKESIEKHLIDTELVTGEFQVILNVIFLDLQALTSSNNNISRANNYTEDSWPNDVTSGAVRDVLRQSSMFSRVNILLIPQQHLRKFMLSVYDQNMANGLYTFINMPLLLAVSDDQVEQGDSSSSKQQNYVASTGENVFVWHSLLSSRNSQAKQAFESLMSIYLKTPTTKAYVYFASKLSNLANFESVTTAASVQTTSRRNSSESMVGHSKIQLSINPYSASFYDCLQIYSTALNESLNIIQKEKDLVFKKKLKADLHANISSRMRNRRYTNMLTGTVSINENGDREVDYTLDDMNAMTGKFAPVILYKGDTKEIERLSRIHWSSDSSVGPTVDSVDCQLTGTCPVKPLSRFFVTLILIATPLALVVGSVLYFVYSRIRLESQLVDYWWKIDFKEIELIATRRKRITGARESDKSGSQVSSQVKNSRTNGSGSDVSDRRAKEGQTGFSSEPGKTTITRVTETFSTSAADVSYGDIVLGIYKLNKVAIKPISKFHQSRKLLIELRTIRSIQHNNLCRFVGLVVDEPNQALVSEFCPKGSLREFFQSDSIVIDWTFKYSIINDIIAGLLYLHSSPIRIHGRLKASNCLVSSRFVVKLSDYGLQSLYENLDNKEDKEALLKKQIWLAPEHLKSNGHRSSRKGDVYSFGLLLYEVLTNNIPFYNSEKDDYVMPLNLLYDELKSRGVSEKTGIDFSLLDTSEKKIDQLVELMQQCWCFEPSRRPSSLVVNTALKKITRGVTSKKLLENLTSRMEQYTNNLESLVDAKLATLVEEKLKTEELLYQFVPKSIASLLKEGQSIEPEAFECVTVFYSDIVGFTSLSSESSPIEVIDFLSDLYLCFDETLEQYDIFKVDTIGDAYIVASGLPQRNEGKHVIEIACAALELRERLASFKIPHRPNRSLEMRVGIHSGPCVAGIVGGHNMPKYCVFGDTLTIGKYMESSGQPMKIHITEESKNLLDGSFKIEPRIPKISKDGLPMQTYWLEKS